MEKGENMVALVGFLMIIAIVVLLLKGKMSPIVVLAVVPAVAALILGYDPVTIADFIKEGVKTTTNNGILFIFSVIYECMEKMAYGSRDCRTVCRSDTDRYTQLPELPGQSDPFGTETAAYDGGNRRHQSEK